MNTNEHSPSVYEVYLAAYVGGVYQNPHNELELTVAAALGTSDERTRRDVRKRRGLEADVADCLLGEAVHHVAKCELVRALIALGPVTAGQVLERCHGDPALVQALRSDGVVISRDQTPSGASTLRVPVTAIGGHLQTLVGGKFAVDGGIVTVAVSNGPAGPVFRVKAVQ